MEDLDHVYDLPHRDHEVQGDLGGPLGDHLDVGVGLLDGGEHVSGHPALAQEVVSHGADEGHVVLHVYPLDVVALYAVELLEGVLHVVAAHEERERGQGGGYGVDDRVRRGDPVEDLRHHGGPVGHLGGADGYDREVGLRRDAPEEVVLRLPEVVDQGPGLLRLEGVPDLERDVLYPHGLDGPGVEDLRPEVGQLGRLAEVHLVYLDGVGDYPGVGGHEPVHVGPDLQHVGVHGVRDDGRRVVRASPSEREGLAVGVHSVVSGYDRQDPH